ARATRRRHETRSARAGAAARHVLVLRRGDEARSRPSRTRAPSSSDALRPYGPGLKDRQPEEGEFFMNPENPVPSRTASELKNEIQKGLDLIRTMRDEVRVRIHLAGMDAKDEWRKLEPHIAEVERTAGELTAAARGAVSEAVRRLAKLRSSLD